MGNLLGRQPKWFGEVGELQVKAKFDRCARTSRDGLALALTGTVEKELAKTFIHDSTRVVIGMRGGWDGKVAWENPDADRRGVCKPVDKPPLAFEARCIRAGPLRSALLLARIALLFALRSALPARRSAPLGARARLSKDC